MIFLHRRYIAVNQEDDIIFIMKKWSSSYKGDSEYPGNVIPLYSGTELYIKREYIGILEQQFGTLMMELVWKHVRKLIDKGRMKIILTLILEKV